MVFNRDRIDGTLRRIAYTTTHPSGRFTPTTQLVETRLHKRCWILIGVLFLALTGAACRRSENETQLLGPEQMATGTSTTSQPTPTAPLLSPPPSEGFAGNLPIWAHDSPPAPHEIVLFRHSFTLDELLWDAELLIFADTRYEVWIDGSWVGRGPARFSRSIREYDRHPLEQLQPGSHRIAVLVQWAPNTRRSESDTPLLLSHIQGTTSQGFTAIARTGSQWQALLSSAWRQDAAPVHSLNLIGPTELVDLQQLPRDWMLPTFSDDEWPIAVVKDTPGDIIYQPRSIPLLVNVPFTPTVIDAGLLSPGRVMGELVPPISDPYTLSFEVLNPTEFVIETLTETETLASGTVLLDDIGFEWTRAGIRRPDVLVATRTIEAGHHILSFAGIPPHGLSFDISAHDIRSATLPFQQGAHAGRRLLLAEPDSQPDQVSVISGEGITLVFPTTPAYAVLDLGRVVHGRLTAKVSGPAGAIVDVGWDERLLPGTLRPLPYPGSLHPPWNQTDSWVLDGTARSISTIDARAGRYILIAAWGEGPIRLAGVRVYEERYPAVQRGWFDSSNERLDEIWQVGVESLYPNMNDAYIDTPWRERGQWWGDVFVEDHISRVAFGDTRLLRRGLLFMAEAFSPEGRPVALAPNGGGTFLIDYGLLWVQSLYDYQQVTGDIPFSMQLYPVVQRFMTYLEGYENPDTGLLDMPFGEWWETALVDWSAPDSRYGQSAALNALYYGTLVDATRIAQATGNEADVLAWNQRADLVRQQMEDLVYLSAQHRYVTTIFEGEAVPPTVHAQAWPLAYGLVPDQEVESLTASLLELYGEEIPGLPPNVETVEVYGMFWMLRALGEAGRTEQALDLIETAYGRMLERGATTWWEGFKTDQYYYSTLSHGWGGAPTWFLTTYILGVRQMGPNTWVVKPSFDGVLHASGALPLQEGSVEVEWQSQNCRERRLRVTAPVTSSGEIVIPVTAGTTALVLNNRTVWQGGAPLVDGIVERADGVHIPLEGGAYLLSVHQDCASPLSSH